MDEELVYNNLEPGQFSHRDLKHWPLLPVLIKGEEKNIEVR